jgi:hypothetical protein
MSELHDLSKLPKDPAYWAGLEARLSAQLGPMVAALPGRDVRTEWWTPVSARAWALGSLAVAAGLAALLLLPPREADPSPPPTGFLRPPNADAAILEVATAPQPPALASLLFSSAGPR